MLIIAFVLGLVCGLSTVFLASNFRKLELGLRYRLGADEKYLLSAARSAGGRLLVGEEPSASGPAMLRLREVPGHRPMEKRDQMLRLLYRGLVKQDPSGVEGRYVLTPEGWACVSRIPVLKVEVKRTGTWFNSVSRRPQNPRK